MALPPEPYTVVDLTRARAGPTCVRQLADINVKEVFDDPQVRHLGLATKVTHPRLGDLEVQNLPVTLSRTPGAVRMPAPELGQHTDEVLGKLGYSGEDVAALYRDGVV